MNNLIIEIVARKANESKYNNTYRMDFVTKRHGDNNML